MSSITVGVAMIMALGAGGHESATGASAIANAPTRAALASMGLRAQDGGAGVGNGAFQSTVAPTGSIGRSPGQGRGFIQDFIDSIVGGGSNDAATEDGGGKC